MAAHFYQYARNIDSAEKAKRKSSIERLCILAAAWRQLASLSLLEEASGADVGERAHARDESGRLTGAIVKRRRGNQYLPESA